MIKLEKMEELEGGINPNNIPIGISKIGEQHKKPTLGECYYLKYSKDKIFRTSIVTEIIDGSTFKTRNSIYKITQQ